MPHCIIAEECALCGACEAECPAGAVAIHSSEEYYAIEINQCTDCGDCVEVCPTDAIRPVEGQPASASE
jgi:ferredoxin